MDGSFLLGQNGIAVDYITGNMAEYRCMSSEGSGGKIELRHLQIFPQ